MWTLAGEDAEVTVDLKVDGQFVVADHGSIAVTLRNKNGDSITGWNRKVLPDTDKTQVSFSIPASMTTLEQDAQLGAIYVRIEWKTEAASYSINQLVRIATFAPIQASGDGVRNRLGAGVQEIPDSSIDLYAAYYKLLPLYPESLPIALRSGVASACLGANNAIEIQAALLHLPALAAKLAQVEAQENSSVTRMKLDIPRLEETLRNQLDQELAGMEQAVSGQDSNTKVTQFLVVTPTDVITGT